MSEADSAPGTERISRRRFLTQGAVASGSFVLAGRLFAIPPASARGGHHRRPVVVIGAGLAGLACARRLRAHGVPVVIYEARERVGGRCWSAHGFGAGQVAEHGGEFIDSDHSRMRALAHRFGLKLEDTRSAYRRRPQLRGRIFIDGKLRAFDEVYGDYLEMKGRLRRDANRIGYIGHGGSPRLLREFDEMSVGEWLDENAPGGHGSLLARAMRIYFVQEFGLEAERLSAISLFYILEGVRYHDDSSDERFHVRGGNDQIPNAIAAGLPKGTVRLGSPLRGLARRGDGAYRLRIEGERHDVIADQVVLALPFTTLRRVDLDDAGLSRLKRKTINELGMGTNAKLLLGFRHRIGAHHRWDGDLYRDRPVLDTWDSSVAQPGNAGLLTVYSGGRVGESYRVPSAHGPAPKRIVRHTLRLLDPAVPGLGDDFSGTAWLDHWSADPWARGSYAAYLPGQLAHFPHLAKRQEGNVHFAGEHTSFRYQGFLEGAVESGERCAAEITS